MVLTQDSMRLLSTCQPQSSAGLTGAGESKRAPLGGLSQGAQLLIPEALHGDTRASPQHSGWGPHAERSRTSSKKEPPAFYNPSCEPRSIISATLYPSTVNRYVQPALEGRRIRIHV